MGILFTLFAVILAFRLWDTEYKSVAKVFAGDFVLLFGIEIFWIGSDLPEGTLLLPELGIVYLGLFVAYLLTKSNIGYVLAGLSAFIGGIHCANPILGLLTVDNYSAIMVGYCFVQYLVFLGGINYELLHRHIPLITWFNPNSHWHKGA